MTFQKETVDLFFPIFSEEGLYNFYAKISLGSDILLLVSIDNVKR